MKLTYLPKKINYNSIGLIVLMLLLSFYTTALVLILIYGIFFALFRKSRIQYTDDQSESLGITFSPVNGFVRNIQMNSQSSFIEGDLCKVTLKISPWREYGVYLPFKGEVIDIALKKGESLFDLGKFKSSNRDIEEGLHLLLRSDEGEEVHLRFLRNKLGLYPNLMVLPGDRGQRLANIGHFPFGGKVELYFSKDCEILVGNEDVVESGRSPLSGKTLIIDSALKE